MPFGLLEPTSNEYTAPSTNLKNSNLKNADLEGANFSGAVLDGVRILRKDYKYIEQYIDESKVVFEN